ncbi:MAG: hypothetical protein LBD82_05230 [Deltaproteobacteria bacterium]|jgi:hypothetical protein|nr:hypothetical protein [Deltaproteobacteria bacterium]
MKPDFTHANFAHAFTDYGSAALLIFFILCLISDGGLLFIARSPRRNPRSMKIFFSLWGAVWLCLFMITPAPGAAHWFWYAAGAVLVPAALLFSFHLRKPVGPMPSPPPHHRCAFYCSQEREHENCATECNLHPQWQSEYKALMRKAKNARRGDSGAGSGFLAGLLLGGWFFGDDS